MSHYRLERDHDIPLEFDGELLADVSSHDKRVTGTAAYVRREEARWTEFRIYRTDSGKYVVETVGRTTIKNESDRHAVVVLDNPTGVPAAVRGPRNYTTFLGKQALEEAHRSDPSVPLTERV